MAGTQIRSRQWRKRTHGSPTEVRWPRSSSRRALCSQSSTREDDCDPAQAPVEISPTPEAEDHEDASGVGGSDQENSRREGAAEEDGMKGDPCIQCGDKLRRTGRVCDRCMERDRRAQVARLSVRKCSKCGLMRLRRTGLTCNVCVEEFKANRRRSLTVSRDIIHGTPHPSGPGIDRFRSPAPPRL